jgi:hypothetical protein
LKRREEFVIKTSWLRSFDFTANISSHSEIGILINTTRNQARNVLISKEMREAT